MPLRVPLPSPGSSATLPPPTDDTASTRSTDQRTPFRRTYVACVSCRTRKVKCIISEKPPCAKCSREHRECVFDNQKTRKKQRAPPIWATSSPKPQTFDRSTYIPIEHDISRVASTERRRTAGVNEHAGLRLGADTSLGSAFHIGTVNDNLSADTGISLGRPSPKSLPHIGNHNTTSSALHTDISQAETQRLRRHSNILDDQVVRTAVSKPTDALHLLFDAAQVTTGSSNEVPRHAQSGRGISSSDARPPVPARSRRLTSSMDYQDEFAILETPEPILPITPAVSNLSFPADNVLDVWGRSRFVIQGWFTAQEAVTYVDL